MNDLSDVTNEEVQELLNRIHERIKDFDINDEIVRQWSREDVDKLLNATRREEKEEAAEEEPAQQEEQIAEAPAEEAEEDIKVVPEEDEPTDDIIIPAVEEKKREATRIFKKAEISEKEPEEQDSSEEKIREIMNPEAKGKDAKAAVRSAKLKLLSFGGSLKKNVKKFAESLRTDSSDENDVRDESEYDEDDFEEGGGVRRRGVRSPAHGAAGRGERGTRASRHRRGDGE